MKIRVLHLRLTAALVMVAILSSGQAQGAPDAALTRVSGPWDKFLPGATFSARCQINNFGDTNTGQCTINVYLSLDTTIDSADYRVGTQEVDGIDPGGYREVSTTCQIGFDVPDGSYYLCAAVSCSGDGDSSNDANHSDYAIIRVLSVPPNPVADAVALPGSSFRAGHQVLLATTVRNAGDRPTMSYSVTYYAATGTDDAAQTYPMGSASRDGLAPRATDNFTATCAFPQSLPDGYYHIKVVIACSNDGNPADNRAFFGPVWIGPIPDLSIQSVDAAGDTYQPGGQVVVSTVVKNVGDRPSDRYAVRYYLSTDATITAQDQNIGSAERSGLTPGGQHSFQTTCRLPSYFPAGRCYVGAILTCSNDGAPANNTGCDNSPATVVHPPGYICGRATYEDTSSWVHPVRYARVKIYNADNDNDPLNDHLLAETSTDADGNFGVVLAPDPTSGPQVYVKVFTEAVSGAYLGTTSTICAVKDDVLKSLYSLKSAPCPYPSEASTTVNMLSPLSAGEFMVYDSIVEGFHKTRVFFNAELPVISIYWPSSNGGTYYSPGEGIWVARYDRGDRDVILHEYGHYVADSHGFGLGSVGLNPFHYWNMDLRSYPYFRTNDEARNLAFREAWATLFCVAVQYGDTSYPYGGDFRYQDTDEVTKKTMMLNLEIDTYAARTPGEYFENMNCCALWDIFDDQNDTRNYQDTLSDPMLVKTWSVVRDYKPKDILDFWNSWFEKYDDRKEMTSIFGNHQMSFKYPKGSGTVATFESGQFDGLAWTTKGDALWTVVSDASHQGTYSARAGSIQAGQSSTLEVALTCEAGRIGFWYKLSTEMGGDMLNFYIDGVRQNNWSGEKDWQRIDFAVPAGAHTFTWKYTKDGSVTRGADTVWLDDVEFPVW